MNHRIRQRRGVTLVHIQSAMAIGAIVIATVSTSLGALYRLQTTTDELRERSAVAHRFEHQLRKDARAANAVEQSDDGELILQVDGREVRYKIGEDRLERTVEKENGVARDALFLPTGVSATLGYAPDSRTVLLTLSPDAQELGPAESMISRRIRATVGRPEYQWEAE